MVGCDKSRFFVPPGGDFKFGTCLVKPRYAGKSGDLGSFVKLTTSRLLVRFSKWQKRVLLKKLKILDTHITI